MQAPGHAGKLCGQCDASYSRTIGGVCIACRDRMPPAVSVPLLLVLLVAWVVYTIASTLDTRKDDAMAKRHGEPLEMKRQGLILSQLTTFVQCIGIAGQLPIDWPTQFMSDWLSALGSVSASVGDLAGSACVVNTLSSVPEAFWKLWVTCYFIPVLVAVAIPLVFWCMHTFRNLVGEAREPWARFRERRLRVSYLVVVNILWPSICGRAVTFLLCVDVMGNSLMADDTSQSCDSTMYRVARAFAVVSVCACCVLPLAIGRCALHRSQPLARFAGGCVYTDPQCPHAHATLTNRTSSRSFLYRNRENLNKKSHLLTCELRACCGAPNMELCASRHYAAAGMGSSTQCTANAASTGRYACLVAAAAAAAAPAVCLCVLCDTVCVCVGCCAALPPVRTPKLRVN